MEQAKVKIIGTAPLLMNKFTVEKPDDTKVRRKDEQYSVEKDAKKLFIRTIKSDAMPPHRGLRPA